MQEYFLCEDRLSERARKISKGRASCRIEIDVARTALVHHSSHADSIAELLYVYDRDGAQVLDYAETIRIAWCCNATLLRIELMPERRTYGREMFDIPVDVEHHPAYPHIRSELDSLWDDVFQDPEQMAAVFAHNICTRTIDNLRGALKYALEHGHDVMMSASDNRAVCLNDEDVRRMVSTTANACASMAEIRSWGVFGPSLDMHQSLVRSGDLQAVAEEVMTSWDGLTKLLEIHTLYQRNWLAQTMSYESKSREELNRAMAVFAAVVAVVLPLYPVVHDLANVWHFAWAPHWEAVLCCLGVLGALLYLSIRTKCIRKGQTSEHSVGQLQRESAKNFE